MVTFIDGGVTAPKGFLSSGVHCGIRKGSDKNDLALILSSTLCDAAGVYTKNRVKGAPILVTKAHLKNGKARAVICNSGNANTCNPDGEEKAKLMCREIAARLDIDPEDVIVGSTGVIGQIIDTDIMVAKMPELCDKLSADYLEATTAIMTTDTRPKYCAVETVIDGKPVRIGAMAKGSGMIHPDMATMLCFLTSDAKIAANLLEKALKTCIADTFHMMSIDGDTSTNDTCTIMANGLAGNEPIIKEDERYQAFCQALQAVCEHIVKKLAADGEGATRLITCTVGEAPDKQTARLLAKSVVTSSLVKTAIFGADANWGRILCALGYAGAEVSFDQTSVYLGSSAGKIQVCRGGRGIPFSEELAKQILLQDEIDIEVSLGLGAAQATAWGCDLSYDYVKINGDYRT